MKKGHQSRHHANQPIILASWSHQRQLSLAIATSTDGSTDPDRTTDAPVVRIDPMWCTKWQSRKSCWKKNRKKTTDDSSLNWRFWTPPSFVSRLIMRGAIEEDWGLEMTIEAWVFLLSWFFIWTTCGCVWFWRFVPRLALGGASEAWASCVVGTFSLDFGVSIRSGHRRNRCHPVLSPSPTWEKVQGRRLKGVKWLLFPSTSLLVGH